MHLKCYEIDGKLLRTGAANFSASGLKRLDNDLIVIESADAAAAFERASRQILGFLGVFWNVCHRISLCGTNLWRPPTVSGIHRACSRLHGLSLVFRPGHRVDHSSWRTKVLRDDWSCRCTLHLERPPFAAQIREIMPCRLESVSYSLVSSSPRSSSCSLVFVPRHYTAIRKRILKSRIRTPRRTPRRMNSDVILLVPSDGCTLTVI
jgi:hypothetical protein